MHALCIKSYRGRSIKAISSVHLWVENPSPSLPAVRATAQSLAHSHSRQRETLSTSAESATTASTKRRRDRTCLAEFSPECPYCSPAISSRANQSTGLRRRGRNSRPEALGGVRTLPWRYHGHDAAFRLTPPSPCTTPRWVHSRGPLRSSRRRLACAGRPNAIRARPRSLPTRRSSLRVPVEPGLALLAF